MKISTIVFATLLCLICFFSCTKRSATTPQVNGISVTINGVDYAFNYHDSLRIYSSPTPSTVTGYAGADTTDTVQNRIIISLGVINPNSGAVNFRPADSVNSSSGAVTVSTVLLLNAVAIGTFQGNIYLNGDSTKTKSILTNGQFDVANP
jgi:hypothetical protein